MTAGSSDLRRRTPSCATCQRAAWNGAVVRRVSLCQRPEAANAAMAQTYAGSTVVPASGNTMTVDVQGSNPVSITISTNSLPGGAFYQYVEHVDYNVNYNSGKAEVVWLAGKRPPAGYVLSVAGSTGGGGSHSCVIKWS